VWASESELPLASELVWELALVSESQLELELAWELALVSELGSGLPKPT
jgi:hypothetical protein